MYVVWPHDPGNMRPCTCRAYICLIPFKDTMYVFTDFLAYLCNVVCNSGEDIANILRLGVLSRSKHIGPTCCVETN